MQDNVPSVRRGQSTFKVQDTDTMSDTLRRCVEWGCRPGEWVWHKDDLGWTQGTRSCAQCGRVMSRASYASDMPTPTHPGDKTLDTPNDTAENTHK